MSDRKKIRLTDLVEPEAYAELSVGDLQVHKLGAGDIANILLKFPALLTVFESGKISPSTLPVLGDSAPEAVPTLVALAAGMPGKKGVTQAKILSATDQVKVIKKALEISMPGGIENFFDDLAQLMEGLAPVPEAPGNPDVVRRPD